MAHMVYKLGRQYNSVYINTQTIYFRCLNHGVIDSLGKEKGRPLIQSQWRIWQHSMDQLWRHECYIRIYPGQALFIYIGLCKPWEHQVWPAILVRERSTQHLILSSRTSFSVLTDLHVSEMFLQKEGGKSVLLCIGVCKNILKSTEVTLIQ